MNGFADAEQIMLLGIALAIGLLIGIERGWRLRDVKEGERIAGLRTYGLIGLLGGVSGLFSQYLGVPAFGFIFVGFTIAVTVSYAMQWKSRSDSSITSLISMLLTFLLGALAAMEHVNLAASSAVIVAIILRFKDVLHGWLKQLEKQELHAALQLLLISIVLLPVLPDKGYGPWEALNPYEIWWMVVLIAGISFVGYFTMKIAGEGKGVLLTAVAGGLASSTALTLHYARLSQTNQNMKNLLAAGILIACGTMFPRVVLVASLINPALFNVLVLPMLVMTLMTLGSAVIIWHKRAERSPEKMTKLSNPLELKAALFFGMILVIVILLSKAAVFFFGESVIYLLAAVSGIADVDSINLTLSGMSSEDLSLNVAVMGIVIASCSNTLVKAMLAVFIGGRSMGGRVLLPLMIAAASGLIVAIL